jgi:LysR family glycine cleavage system transcriptional activator
MTLELFPVCSPDLPTKDKPLTCPADLVHHTLLHDESWNWREGPEPGWEMWLKALGESGVDARRGLRLEGSVLTLQAAAMGRGVALASSGIADDDLVAGRLIRPFDPKFELALDLGIFFVCAPEALERPAVEAFRQWVMAEAEAGTKLRRGGRVSP